MFHNELKVLQMAVLLLFKVEIRCTAAYSLIVATLVPPVIFRRSHFRRQVPPRLYDARDPSSERWNCGQECWPVILPKCRLPRFI